MVAGDHDLCYLRSTVPVKENFESIEGKGEVKARWKVERLKVGRFKARNGKLKKGCADCAGGGELRGGSDLFGRFGGRAELW
jgi:hypothetical protein